MKTVPTGFPFRSCARSRDASRGQRESRVRFFARAFRHRARDLRAHRPVFRDETRIDPQHFRLRLVGISDEAGEKNCGSAGHIRDSVREKTARARFGDRERLLSFRQKFHHDFFEIPAVARENGRAQRRGDDRIRAIERCAVAHNSQVHFPRPGAIAEFQPGKLEQPFADRFLDKGFAHSRDAVSPTIDRRLARNDRAENWQNETLKHRMELAGRARKKKQMRQLRRRS